MSALDACVRIVLVRTEEGGNVGAAARVMANFGLGDLALVAPRLARPEDRWKWAKGAEDIVEGALQFPDLASALRDCAWAWAATRRRGRLRGRALAARDAAGETVAAAATGQRTAWVFGPESRGLSTAEVALCSGRVTIPTHPRQPSLNLAQAVAVCCYEVFARAQERAGMAPAPAKVAPLEEREALYRHLEAALLVIGYLDQRTARIRMSAIKKILDRSGLTPREVRTLRGVARQMEWTGRRRDGGAG